jgi:DNA-binding MarR family transcriptional regulator
MSSLHPIDELNAHRRNTSLTTLTAKQIEAAELQAKLNEFLAGGGQIITAEGHTGKAIPFCPSNADAVAKKNAKWKEFEITPQDKPKKQPVRTGLHPKTAKALEVQKQILEHMRQNGATAAHEITDLLGMTRQTTDLHITKMMTNGLIEHVATLGLTRFYNIKGKGLQGKQLQPRNFNAKRGESTRAEIMQFLRSKGCPQKMRAIAKAIDQCDTNTNKHVKILIENGLVRVADESAYPKLYEVVK